MAITINGNEVVSGNLSGGFIPPLAERKIMIGRYELKISDLEKLIEFAQSGKLDEIMKS